MNKRIELTKKTMTERTLVVEATTSLEGQRLRAKGQMLVDSDALAFIYILDNGEEFVYASLPDTLWPDLKIAREQQYSIYLDINEEMIELVDLIDELNYLLENIKDNANYGEEMEGRVVEVFSLA
ncbi:hypothetical protein [Bacillus weihaiensis]|uniref:UPF0738 protein A9C19_14815 n=1 Tax=Bacillus weihaiensis TaxID=1547283 RepID=A0A1L3MU81_9BACI|nr:hypothetical protein [Bacillus weihaiensis]APH05905.1 hypothetical protein A9C19_14815 [Bacillus weihaiensis]